MLSRYLTYENSRKLRASLSRLGINLRMAVNARPLDFRGQIGIHPLEALYKAKGRDVIVTVPTDKCVFDWLHFSSVSINSSSAKIKTLTSYENGHFLYENSFLEFFYSNFQPKSAGELLRINSPSYKEFNSLPPEFSILPWESLSPKDKCNIEAKITKSEFREASTYKFTCNQFFGPAPRKFGEFEFNRLVNAYKSIKQFGLIVDLEGFNNINATLLVDKSNDYSCFIRSGQHRTAAVAALGHSTIDIQIRAINSPALVSLNSIEHWPGVTDKYFTKEEAENIFNRCFNFGVG